MNTNYKLTTPWLYKGLTADEAAAELERIRQKHGILKPELVVEESKDEGSVFHKCFQWDDNLAAEAWRNEQARALIKNIVVVVTNDNVQCSVRALVNVARVEGGARSYVPIVEAIHDDTAYRDLLAQAKEEMETFITKYSQIVELNQVKAAMLKVINS